MNAEADFKGNALPDAPARNLATRYLPGWAMPYAQMARLDRPIGWWLLLLPCWWSSAIAGIALRQPPNILHMLLFWIGAIAMRGAGSTWNDILDRDLDRQVERTRERPLASGRIALWQAAVFLALQCLVGLAVLLCFNRFAIGLGFTAMIPVLIYPLMKRVTNHPQIVLGLAFAWGALMGWAAVLAALDIAPLLLYAAAIAWTVGYDTIYAQQDIEDDSIIGIGSTAIAYGGHVGRFVAACYLATIALMTLMLPILDAGIPSWCGLAGFALLLGWQVVRMRLDDPKRALSLFRSNRNAGLVLLVGLSADAVGLWLTRSG